MENFVIITAQEKREQEKPIRAIDAIKREIAQLENLERETYLIKEYTKYIFSTLKNLIESNNYSCIHTFYYQDFGKDCDFYNNGYLRKSCKIIEDCLKEAGYEIHNHEYSDSWQRTSGKFCEIFIKW